MIFVTRWARASIRQRWRTLVAIALLSGLIGGLSLFAIAGARRTQSAYSRFLRWANPSTMAVDVRGIDVSGYETLDDIAHLPQVVQARTYVAFYTAPWVNGHPDLSQSFEVLGSLDGRYFDQDRFRPLRGRLPDPSRADEVAVNEESARLYGYHVGQRIDFATVSRADVEDPANQDSVESLQPRLLTHSTIVGIGVFIEEVAQDDTDRWPLVLFTPAYVSEAKGLESYGWQGLVLRNGDADVDAVERRITEKSGGAQAFRVTSTDKLHADQAMRPVSLALAAFGGIVGLACLVLVGQALARYVRGEREGNAIARALGAGPVQIVAATAIAPAMTVVVGAVLAVTAAVLVSPAMPIGQVRRVEVASGVNADWAVFGLGALGSITALFVLIVVLARRGAPRRVQPHPARTARLGRVEALAATNVPPAAAMGLRFAVAPGHGSTSVPVRSVIVSAIVGVAALIAAVTFGSSMQHLVSNPRLFGWNWDVALVDGSGYGNTKPSATKQVFAHDDNIVAWSGAFYGADEVNGRTVPLLGMDPSSSVTPPIHKGRMIERAGEIVLGTASLAQLDLDVGDTVHSTSGALRIVGSATFPTIGVVHGDHTSLGVGGIVIPQQVPGYARNLAGGDPSNATATAAADYGPNVLFVRFRDGIDKRAAVERLESEADQVADYNGVVVTSVQRSAEIVNADQISGSSALLGGGVALSAIASVALALSAAVRRRRRDLAVLKALGFTRRQVSATIAWQATVTIAIGLLVGIPLAVVLGRWTWTLFAGQLDVVAQPVVPLTAIALIVLAAVAAVNVLATMPARYARGIPTTLALRSE